MEHKTHIKSIKGHGVRVYRRSVPADTEVPPPVPKRTTSMAMSQAATSSSASPAMSYAAAAALPARGHAAAAVPTRGHAAVTLPTRGHVATTLPTRGHAAVALPARGHVAAAFPARGHAVAALPAIYRNTAILPARNRAPAAHPAVGRPAAALPVVGRPAAALPVVGRSAAALTVVGRPPATLPVVGRPPAALPVVGRPAAALPVVGRPAAALPVVGRPAAALPVVSRPAAALPVIGRPAAALPAVGRPAAALPVVGRPAAALPAEDCPAATLPDNGGEVGAVSNIPQPQPGIAGFVSSILCKTTATISNGIERSFRSLMSRRHHDSYRPAAVTDAFLQRAGLTGIMSIDMARANIANIEPSSIELSDMDIADIDTELPIRGYGLSMILNGSVCPLSLYGDVPYFVKNSCPFDSVIVAVANAYMDYEQYAEFVNTADNAFLQFAKELGMYGPSKTVYDKRVELLLPFFKFVADTYCYTPPTLRTLDVECNVWKIVQDYLKRDPSSIQVKTCSNEEGCPGGLERIQYSASVVLNDCEKIRTEGFSCLHQLMDAYIKTEKTTCGKYGCDGITHSKRIMGRHVFIETDSLSTTSDKFMCSLGDVPLALRLAGDEFVLQAVINFTSFHYVTYVRRPSGQWEIHNDLESEIRIVREVEDEKVCPHAIIYIKT